MRKIHIVISFVLLLAAGSLAAWDGFTHVSAIAQGVGIRIEWQAKDEHDVKYYEIYRSRSEDDVFSGTRILRQAPLGERAQEYTIRPRHLRESIRLG
ncbi:MAG: hypothetical protein U5N26_11860 [Candidatus Marinimicrobia bacterium]|nr:hypothetical protein [Candidatus Neomarinimicrobiota bacterium]